MSKYLVILLILVSNLFGLFILIPQVSAAEPCKNTQTASGTINFFPIDGSGSPITHIPEGSKAVKLKFTNLEPGYYRLEMPQRLAGAYYTKTEQANSSGEVILVVDNQDKLVNGTHTGNLQFSSDGSAAKLNPQYCREVRYTVGYPPSACTMDIVPSKPTSKQKFTIQVNNAPTGNFEIIRDDKPFVQTRFNSNPRIGNIIVNQNGISINPPLLNPLAPGKYALYLANTSTPSTDYLPVFIPGGEVGDLLAAIPKLLVVQESSRMCWKELEVVGAGTGQLQPSCTLLDTSVVGDFDKGIPGKKEFKMRAFNLKPNTNYELSLEKDRQTKSLPSQNSGPGEFDTILITGSDVSPGSYKGSVKNPTDGRGCEVTFILDGDGNLQPGSVASYKQCADNDPTCTNSGLTTCTSSLDKPTRGIPTAIGCIPTEPVPLIQTLLRFVIAIGGGIAFLFMLLGAFGMITSGDNPDALKEGQDRFYKAIEGLLFIIFAVLLLKIIGVDILGLGRFFE